MAGFVALIIAQDQKTRAYPPMERLLLMNTSLEMGSQGKSNTKGACRPGRVLRSSAPLEKHISIDVEALRQLFRDGLADGPLAREDFRKAVW